MIDDAACARRELRGGEGSGQLSMGGGQASEDDAVRTTSKCILQQGREQRGAIRRREAFGGGGGERVGGSWAGECMYDCLQSRDPQGVDGERPLQ